MNTTSAKRVRIPWYTMEGVGLVCAANILAFAALMPLFIRGALQLLGLEHAPIAGAALIAPYTVLQALAQLLAFILVYRSARARLKTHFARAVIATSSLFAVLAIGVIALLILLAMRA